jgi:hypothetical protein
MQMARVFVMSSSESVGGLFLTKEAGNPTFCFVCFMYDKGALRLCSSSTPLRKVKI